MIHTEQIGLPFDENSNWIFSKCGTCHISWGETESTREIYGIGNSQPNNGDFDITLKWFEEKSREDKKSLYFLHFENQAFKKHLIEKRGFVLVGPSCVVKKFE